MSCVHQNDSGIAIDPPMSDNTRLSVNDCLRSLSLPQPIAPRIANSRARAAVRAICRLARSTHARSSTRKVRPNEYAEMRRITGLTRLSAFFFQAEDGIRDVAVTGVQTCALPI